MLLILIDHFLRNNFCLDKFFLQLLISIPTQLMPLSIGKNGTLLHSLAQNMKISLFRWINKQKVVNRSTQLLPKLCVLLEITKINLTYYLTNINRRSNPMNLLQLLVVRLMHHHPIRVTILHKIHQLLTHHQNSLVPLSLYVVRPLMVNSGEYFS